MSNNLDTYKTWKRRYLYDIVMAMIVFLIPLLIYIHLLVPEDVQIISFFGQEYDTGYADVRTYFWYQLSHTIPIILITFWYFNNSHWWRSFVLITMTPYMYRLIRYTFFYPDYLATSITYFAIIFTIIAFLFLIGIDKLFFESDRRPELSRSLKKILAEGTLYHKIKGKLDLLDRGEGMRFTKIHSQRILHLKNLLVIERNNLMTITKRNAVNINKSEITIVLILLINTFLFFTFKLVPEEVKELEILGYVIDSHGFSDVNIFIWYVAMKLCAIIPLIIWFFTAQNWWRYSILSPILIFTYQLWEGFKDTNTQIDETEYLAAFPLLLTLLIVLVTLSYLMNYRPKLARIYDQLAEEEEELISSISGSKMQIKSKEALLEELKQNGKSNKEDSKQRLDHLYKLREELIREMEVNLERNFNS